MGSGLATYSPATPADALGDVIRQYMAVTERLTLTHEALQTEVIRLRREIESKDQELQRRQRLSSLGELAAGVAHEVRNPLGAIQLYSELLKARCGGMDGAAKLIEKIESGIRAIDGVVQDTLALAPRSHRVRACSVAELIANAADACRPALERRAVRLAIDLDDRECGVLADQQAIQRVLINLIVNAAEASPSQSEIRVSVESSVPGTITIRVSDAGCGLPPEALTRLFEPFFTTKATGTGLGLAIAHRLVEAHGGTLRAANRAPRGAEFSLTLPAASEVNESNHESLTADAASAA